MIKTITIKKSDSILRGRFKLPASKSISNRILIIQALSGNEMTIDNLSEADDTVLLKKLLNLIHSPNGLKKVTEIDAANAGTTFRFLTAYLSIRPGKWMLTGSERMKQRPVEVLVEALQRLGADISYLAKHGYPPLLIEGKALRGGEVTIESGISSQYATALMLIGAVLPTGLTINLKGKQVSSPYRDMTVQLMKIFGIQIHTNKRNIRIFPGKFIPASYSVEADWSAAAFWYEAVALSSVADIFLEGLTGASIQGDAILPELFQTFGVNTTFYPDGVRLQKVPSKIDGFYYDFSDHPDLAQAVIATCAGLGIRSRFEGLGSLLIKETDRLRAMKNEIEKMGIKVNNPSVFPGMPIIDLEPVKQLSPSDLYFETYGDHRMAMALAPLAMKGNKLKIRNPEVVSKSYPGFWEHLADAGFDISQP